ncbi:MAG: DUF2752 domain-containing protein [Chitinophagia bacterium]|nr:DUF2752 domain-containing protein [Chitinophagia bacterium]
MNTFIRKDVGTVFVALLPLMMYLVPLDWLARQETLCLYHAITGEFCVGCGISKALVAMVQFEFQRAWSFNRLVVLVGPLLAWQWALFAQRRILGCWFQYTRKSRGHYF